MSLFEPKKSKCFGIYSLYDPAVKDQVCKFSPPFFSPSDDIACSALCETLRRHNTSFEALIASDFLRMELWRLGSFEPCKGSLLATRSHKYRVCKLAEYFSRDYVQHYMRSLQYPSLEQIKEYSKE